MKINNGSFPRTMSRGHFLRTCVGPVVVVSVIPGRWLAQAAEAPQQNAGKEINQARMIIDQLNHAESYFGMHPAFAKAFAFLRQSGVSQLAPGKHVVDGERVFCLISKGPGRTRAEAKLEAHRRYIDIQYIIAGTDEMGGKPTAACQTVDQPYDAAKDIIFYADKPETWTKVVAGSFAIFYPRDAHAPLVSSGEIHKAVVKVALD
jgi:biofilm protein TabA